MLDERIARIALRQRGIVSRKQLITCGLSSSGIATRIRGRRLFPVVRGVYALGPHVDAWGRRYAAVLVAGGDPQRIADVLAASPPGIHDGLHDRSARPHDLRSGTPDGSGPPNRTIGGPASPHGVRDALPARPPGPHGPTASRHPRLVTLSHWSALYLYELIDRPPTLEHVTLEGTGERRPAAAVRVHRARTLDPRDVRIVEGLPVTTPARTILDAALGASERQVRRLIREAEYRELLGVGAVADVVRRNRFHPGAPTVGRADPVTAESRRRQTPIEDRMTRALEHLPLAFPETQLVVVGRSGQAYHADFAWLDLRLIIETDGRSSHDRTTSFQSDRDRDADLAATGWLTLRFTSLQLDDPARVAATILATARTRSAAN